jgi:hypothetical protein
MLPGINPGVGSKPLILLANRSPSDVENTVNIPVDRLWKTFRESRAKTL